MMSEEKNPVRFAIIGCGIIAQSHAKAIAECPDAELVAVSDIIGERAQKFAKEHGVSRFFADNEALLSLPEVEVVSVCTPSGVHGEVSMAAFRARKHVLCEKPLEIHASVMAEMIEAAETSGVQLGAVYQRRATLGATKVKALLQQGQLGPLVLADASLKYHRSSAYYRSGDWRATWALDGGGALMNQGIHGIDMLQWLVGDIVRVRAQVRTLVHDIAVEDTAVAMVEFANGALGAIMGATSVYPEFSTRFAIHGRDGSLVFGDHGIEHWTVGRQDQTAQMAEALSGSFSLSHRPFIENMVAVARGEADVLVSGQEARKAVDVILAIYESARTGQAVDIAHHHH